MTIGIPKRQCIFCYGECRIPAADVAAAGGFAQTQDGRQISRQAGRRTDRRTDRMHNYSLRKLTRLGVRRTERDTYPMRQHCPLDTPVRRYNGTVGTLGAHAQGVHRHGHNRLTGRQTHKRRARVTWSILSSRFAVLGLRQRERWREERARAAYPATNWTRDLLCTT